MRIKDLLEHGTYNAVRLATVLTPEVFAQKKQLVVDALVSGLDNGDLNELIARLEDKVLTPEEVRERLDIVVRMLPKAMRATVNGKEHPYIYAEEDTTGGRSASIGYLRGGAWLVHDFQEYEKEFEDEEDAAEYLADSWRKMMAEKS